MNPTGQTNRWASYQSAASSRILASFLLKLNLVVVEQLHQPLQRILQERKDHELRTCCFESTEFQQGLANTIQRDLDLTKCIKHEFDLLSHNERERRETQIWCHFLDLSDENQPSGAFLHTHDDLTSKFTRKNLF